MMNDENCRVEIRLNNDSITLLQRTTKLKQMLNSPDLEFIMEAHNGLCARIVQEAGNIAFFCMIFKETTIKNCFLPSF